MLPARERLEAVSAPVRERDDGLEMHDDLVALDGPLEVERELALAGHAVVQAGLVERVAAVVGPLRAVHGYVRVADE